jgi:hypothetical protein
MDAKIKNNDLEHFELIYQSPDWEPGADCFSAMEDHPELETAACTSTGDRSTVLAVNRAEVDVTFAISTYEHELSQSNAILAGISSVYCDELLAQAMREKRTVSVVGSGSRTTLRHETLAKNWNIPLERAKQTLAVTTQRGIRIRPTTPLTRRFKTNDRMLWYERLNTRMVTDTLKAGTLSRRQNKYAQAYVIPPYWTKAYAMRNKSDARHTLRRVFHDVSVPETLVIDGSKEQTIGEFRKKCHDAGAHVHQTEPYSPWQDRAELAIWELKKKKTRRVMMQSRCPKRLWDDCLELMADNKCPAQCP